MTYSPMVIVPPAVSSVHSSPMAGRSESASVPAAVSVPPFSPPPHAVRARAAAARTTTEVGAVRFMILLEGLRVRDA